MSAIPRRRVVAAAAAALLAGAVVTWVTDSHDPAPPEALAAEAGPAPVAGVPSGAPTGPASPPPGPHPATAPQVRRVATHDADPASLATRRSRSAVPTRVAIPAIDAAVDVSPVGIDPHGAMALPEDPRQAGWYRFSAHPGDPAGATVIAAHVDSHRYGVGPLAKMTSLRAGDTVDVAATGRTVRYVVATVLRLDKDSLDTDALFDRGGRHRLHLVTCGGAFDARSGRYAQNVVATAYPMKAG